MALDKDGKVTGAAGQDHRQSRRLHVDRSRRRCRPISTRRCCRASTTSRRSIAEVDAVYTNTAPVDAYRGAGRPGGDLRGRAAGGDGGARAEASIRPSCAARTSSRTFPHQTPVIMAYDAGDYDASLDQALKIADYAGFASAQGAKRPSDGKLRGIGYLGLHRGLRHRAVDRRSARSAPASACGKSAEVRVNPTGTVEVLTGSHSHGQGHETTFAQLVAERLGIPIEQRRDRPRRHRQGAVRHGHLRLALAARSACRRSSRRSTRSRPRPRRSPRTCSKRPKATSSSRTASSRSPAPTSRSRLRRGRARRLHRAQLARRQLEPGLKETAFYDPTNFTFPAGCHICEVEVDPDTGKTEIVSFDGGRRFRHHHQSDDRRRPGAWRHRAGHRPGAARRRGLRRRSGQLADRLATWTTPCRAPTTCRRSRSAPPTTPCPHNPLGIKGCGEAGAIGAPAAVINAITDAIGNNNLDMPATPDRVWHAIHG